MARHTPVIDSRHAGFTLVEALIAVAVLAVSVAAIAGALSASAQQSTAMADDFTCAALARQLLEEVASKSFDLDAAAPSNTVGFSSGNTNRTLYDELSDFDGYWDTFVVSPNGTYTEVPGSNLSSPAVPNATGDQRSFLRVVSVSFQTPPLGPATAAGDCAKVTVTVQSNGGHKLEVSQLFTRTYVR